MSKLKLTELRIVLDTAKQFEEVMGVLASKDFILQSSLSFITQKRNIRSYFHNYVMVNFENRSVRFLTAIEDFKLQGQGKYATHIYTSKENLENILIGSNHIKIDLPNGVYIKMNDEILQLTLPSGEFSRGTANLNYSVIAKNIERGEYLKNGFITVVRNGTMVHTNFTTMSPLYWFGTKQFVLADVTEDSTIKLIDKIPSFMREALL